MKPFTWEEHIKDPTKTKYRNGEKPVIVWKDENGNIYSFDTIDINQPETSPCPWYHYNDGRIDSKRTGYPNDLVIHD